jgi:hypothetical protein
MINHPYIWKAVNDPILGFTNHISKLIEKYEKSRTILLPYLRDAKDLYVFSDYGGEHKDSKCDVYSFLICDIASSCGFLDERLHIRSTVLKNRRMSYKAFNDKAKLSVTDPFLNASNQINGILFSIVIDKDVDNFFSIEEIDFFKSINPDFGNWKRKTQEKLLRLIHFCCLLLSGLSTSNQNIFWFSDEDDILINTERHYSATNIFGLISGLYFKSEMGHFRFGSTKSDSGGFVIEDFCSIPDLASGAICELINEYKSSEIKMSSALINEFPEQLPNKSRWIFNWLADARSDVLLKKVCLIIEKTKENNLDFKFLNYVNREIIF